MKKQLAHTTLATELFAVQEQKNALEIREKELKTALLEALKKQGVKSVVLDNGTSFTRTHRESLGIADEPKAFAWAEEHNCLVVDTSKAMEILRHDLKPLPKFFKRVIGKEYLIPKRREQK